MKSLFIHSVLLFSCFLSSLSAGEGEAKRPNEIIQRARAAVGDEKALRGLTTLQLSGRIDSAKPAVPDAVISIIARKPCSQRLEVRMDDIVETTILHGKDGCVVRTSLSLTASQMRSLGEEEQARIRFSTRQFFSFFLPDSRKKERVTFDGIKPYRGHRCHKLVYSYPDGPVTTRYFSVVNNKLIATVLDTGVESVEIGEQIVEGIKFPEKVEYYQDGEILHTMILTEVKVNKPLASGIFDTPKRAKK